MAVEEGSIVARIKADPSDWNAELDKAEAKAKELAATNPTVKVDTAGVSEAIAAIETVKAAEKSLGGETTTTVRVNTVTSGGDTSKTDAETAAEARLAAALTVAETAASRASIAQMRLDEVRSSGASSGSRLAAAELAVTESTNRAAAAAVKATAASEALSEAQKQAAATAAEEAAAHDADSVSTIAAGAAADITNGKILGMAGGVVALASTIGPLTAAAVGLGGGLAGMGAAGILAVVGIKNAMDEGSATGLQYTAELHDLKNDLDELSGTAATEFLGSFAKAEETITASLPALNSEVAEFTGLLGDGLNSVVDGAVTGLQVLNPLFVEGAGVVDNMASSFDEWTHNGGLQSFVSYAQAELPVVVQTLGDLTDAAVGLGESLAPTGDSMLKLVDDAALLAKGLNSIEDAETGLKSSNQWINDILTPIENALNPIQNLLSVFGGLNGILGTLGITTASTADTTNGATAAQTGLASAVSATADAGVAQLTSSQAATAQMQAEGDAAGLLTNALTLLNGGTLSLAQAQTGQAAAMNSLSDSFAKNGTEIDGNSKAAVANQQAIQAKIQADQAAAEATAKATGSTQAGTEALAQSRIALEQTLQAQGLLTPAVQAYIETNDQVQPEVSTVFHATTAAAQADVQKLISQYASVPRSISTVMTEYHYVETNEVGAPAARANDAYGGTIASHFAGGGEAGTVWGKGSSKSDSVPAMLSVGEEVIQQPYAQKFRPQLKMMNAGIDPYAVAQAAVAPQAAQSARPILMQDGTLFGWVQEIANGQAQLVVNQSARSRATSVSTGSQKIGA
ncbi:hypothetical protein [Subtercola endophyticus]|uniref:hypothetical protein n=1 Tax=Subtercola endophyticus TaxID=2895559 RepID=UPI001E51D72A|nr:hypothetical protein [Subtercola endophyticus]UFS59470.1 hypothetical protein LQ955_01325 [Subtercola endophyticus]